MFSNALARAQATRARVAGSLGKAILVVLGTRPELTDQLTVPTQVAGSSVSHIAAVTLALLAEPRNWIHRRREQLVLLDRSRSQRRVSVDFTLPPLPVPEGKDEQTPTPVVPISLVTKNVLMDFDIRGESGEVLPLLTRRDNQAIAAEVLHILGKEILEAEPSSAIDQDFCMIAGFELHKTTDATENTVATARPVSVRESKEAALRFERANVGDGADAERSGLWRNPLMQRFLREFATEFLLFAVLTPKVGERRVVKFNYEAPSVVRPPKSRLGFPLTALYVVVRAIRIARSFGAYTGIFSLHLSTNAQSAIDAESYHFEVDVPSELRITRARLLASANNRRWTLSSATAIDRAHLYASGLSRETEMRISVRIALGLKASALVWAAFLSGAITTLLLSDEGLNQHLQAIKSSGAGATGVALLVVLPAVVAALLAPREHRLVQDLFIGLRLVILALALMSFAAAVALAPNISTADATSDWHQLFQASRVLTGITGVVLLGAWLRHPRVASMRSAARGWVKGRTEALRMWATKSAPPA